MRHASAKNRQVSGNLPTDVGQRLADFFCEQHPHLTAKYVAAHAHLKVSTVEKMLERKSTPSFETWMALIGAYGFALLAVAYGEVPAALLEDLQAAEIAKAKKARSALDARLLALGA